MVSAVQTAGTRSFWREMRDGGITSRPRDSLSRDDRTAGLDLGIAVKGGVAHVNGEVGSSEEREMVRRLIRRQGGLAVTGRTGSLV